MKALAIFFAFVAIYTLSRHVITSNSTTATTASSTTTVTSTQAPKTLSCKGSDFSAVYNEGQGAAGTIVASVTMSKTTSGWCTLKGWPLLTLQDKTGAVLHSSAVDTSVNPPVQYPATKANQAPSMMTLLQGATTSFSLAYSDVPVGNETCASATTLSVQIKLGGTSITVTPAYPVQPCNQGRIDVSPFYPGP